MLRPTGDGDAQEVVLAFPYDGHLVAAVRTLPGRRFDWDRREWSAPADGWVAAKLSAILAARPELRRSAEFDAWLAAAERRWVGHVRTARYDGRGWFALDTLAPPGLFDLPTGKTRTVETPGGVFEVTLLGDPEPLGELALVIVAGAGAFFACAMLLGIEEMHDIAQVLKRKLRAA